MSSESQGNCKEKDFLNDDNKSPQKTAPCNTPKLDDSTLATECDDLKSSVSFMAYNGMQRSEISNNEKIPPIDLESLYICKEDKSKLNGRQEIYSDEQPLDFSKKSSSVVEDNGLTMHTDMEGGCPQNGENNSECPNKSCNDEVEATVLEFERNIKRHRTTTDPFYQNDGRLFSKAEFKRKRPRAAYSSGSEEEFYTNHSIHRSSSFEQSDDLSQPESPRTERVSAEKKSPHSPYTRSKMPLVPNGHSGNGTACLTGKNDKFLIVDILGDLNKAEQAQTRHEPNESSIQPRISPLSLSRFCYKEENLSPSFTSRSQSERLPSSAFPARTSDISNNANGMRAPYIQTVFPPSPFTNFANRNSSDVPDYPRFFSYPSGAIIQPPFNPHRYMHPHRRSLQVGQNRPRPKEQRPFKAFDATTILNYLPPEVLEEVGSFPCNGSAFSAPVNSSPHSPDSPCIANTSPGNTNEIMRRDSNGEPDRKIIRRIPPEEKDEKYLEKRRKNNLAAKKSRDERRRKEDLIARSVQALTKEIDSLQSENGFLIQNLQDKEMRLDMIKGRLLQFREKCDAQTRELFEDTFRIFLPLQ